MIGDEVHDLHIVTYFVCFRGTPSVCSLTIDVYVAQRITVHDSSLNFDPVSSLTPTPLSSGEQVRLWGSFGPPSVPLLPSSYTAPLPSPSRLRNSSSYEPHIYFGVYVLRTVP